MQFARAVVAVDLRAMSVTEMSRSEGNLRERMMRRLLSIVPAIVVVVSIFTALMPAATQQQDLNGLVARHNQFYRTGNYPAALVEVQKLQAAVMARFGTNHPNYGAALNDLATVGAFTLAGHDRRQSAALLSLSPSLGEILYL
jgi:hypothetical protein